jgi:hypothetical protein
MAAFKKPTGVASGGVVASGNDRRRACRYLALQSQAWLGWWDGPEFRSTVSQVINISLRGCMMTVEKLPPPDQTVWFCPPGTAPSGWIEAKLVEARSRLLGVREVRIAFSSPFPYETFKNVVYGPECLRGSAANGAKQPAEKKDLW